MNVFYTLQVRVRDMFWPLLTTTVGMLVLGFMGVYCKPESCLLPQVLQQGVAAFIATHVAMCGEYFSGQPSSTSYIPMLLIFAPGSGAVLACIGQFHMMEGDVTGTNTNDLWRVLVQQALSYGLPIFVVTECWKNALAKKLLRRVRKKGGRLKAKIQRHMVTILRRPSFHDPPALGQRAAYSSPRPSLHYLDDEPGNNQSPNLNANRNSSSTIRQDFREKRKRKALPASVTEGHPHRPAEATLRTHLLRDVVEAEGEEAPGLSELKGYRAV